MTKKPTTELPAWTTLFQQLFAKTSEFVDGVKSKFAENTLKRRFQQAYATAELKIHDLEGGISASYLEGDIKDLNINRLVERKMESAEAKQIMEYLAEEYERLFGEAIA